MAQRRVVKAYRDQWREGNRIAVVVTIVGDYDALLLPHRPLPGADYICFSDRARNDWGLFDIRPIDFHHADPTRTARHVKTHLPDYLGDYDFAIWIDANILVSADIGSLLEAFRNSGKPFGALFHPVRQSVHDEAAACLALGLDRPEIIDEQMAAYRAEGFDCDDLIESNFFIAALNDPGFRRFTTLWAAAIDRYSRRDQLSINHAVRAAGIHWHPLLPRGQCMRTALGFRLLQHRHEVQGSRPPAPDIGQVIDPYRRARSPRIRPMPASIDIVICIHNALAVVRACLASVIAARNGERLILIDDGSDSETATFLKTFAGAHTDVVLIRSETATGYTRAVNRGIAASTADFVILLNSDTIVSRDWTARLADALTRTRHAGLVGPLSNAASFQSIPDIANRDGQTAINPLPAGTVPADLDEFCRAHRPAVLPQVPILHGFCLGIDRAVIEAIGGMDEATFPEGFGEENDYCFRARAAGFALIVATDTYVFHAKSQSYGGERRARLVAASDAAFAAKHGVAQVVRAVETLRVNPLLEITRRQVARFYRRPVARWLTRRSVRPREAARGE